MGATLRALRSMVYEATTNKDVALIKDTYSKLFKKSRDKGIAGKALAHDFKFRAVKTTSSGKLQKVQTRSGRWIDVTKTPETDDE